jgi:FAD/FMN-containing dehydrogenase
MVTPAGDLIEINESDPDLLQVARSSYGLFGIVYEATFRVRPLAALDVHHESFSLEEFGRQLPALKARGYSMMLYMNPFLDRVTVEFRQYHPTQSARDLTDWQWRIRDYVWSYMAPLYTYFITKYVPVLSLRYQLVDLYHRLIVLALVWVIRGKNTVPQAQQIKYPAESDNSRYTFSIWAFPESTYIAALTRYFEFSREYLKRTGFRVNLLSVGYRIRADKSSLFSYSFDGDVMTFDPCSTGNEGWDEFLQAYNSLCSELGGVPLFNQTNLLTRPQVEKAFGDRLRQFDSHRRHYDPDDRLLNNYFRDLIAQPSSAANQQLSGGVTRDVAAT